MYHDGGGLYLQITSASARSWLFRYWVADRDPATGEFLRDKVGRICGRSREMGLGSLHVVSLQEARDLAGEYRRMRREGVDPIEAKRTAQMQRRLVSVKAITFKQCAADYIEAHRSEWKDPKHLQQWQNSIAQHAEPIIGNLSVQAIDTTAVHRVLAPIWTSIPETAGRLRGRIEAILDIAPARILRVGAVTSTSSCLSTPRSEKSNTMQRCLSPKFRTSWLRFTCMKRWSHAPSNS
jgi:hypothetical protein